MDSQPPIIPQTPVAKKLRKTKFAGGGSIVQIIGLLLCITIIGAIIGIPLFIIGSSMSRYYVCSNCGNLVVKSSTVCPSCHSQFNR